MNQLNAESDTPSYAAREEEIFYTKLNKILLKHRAKPLLSWLSSQRPRVNHQCLVTRKENSY